VSVTINTKAFERMARDAVMEKLRDCCVLAVATAKENMERTGEPSKAYEYPHVDTATLKGRITFKLDGNRLTGYWGVLSMTAGGKKLIYAKHLETGTENMDPRPWITLTKDECWDRWQKILGVDLKYTQGRTGGAFFGGEE